MYEKPGVICLWSRLGYDPMLGRQGGEHTHYTVGATALTTRYRRFVSKSLNLPAMQRRQPQMMVLSKLWVPFCAICGFLAKPIGRHGTGKLTAVKQRPTPSGKKAARCSLTTS